MSSSLFIVSKNRHIFLNDVIRWKYHISIISFAVMSNSSLVKNIVLYTYVITLTLTLAAICHTHHSNVDIPAYLIKCKIQHAITKEVSKQQYENHVIDLGKWLCDVTRDFITT